MKNFKTLFGMMVVALMAASCTNDVNDVLAPEAPQKGYPFEATIAPKSFDATTRTALVEDTENGTISSTWEVGDKIAIVYLTESDPEEIEAEVKKVAEDGSATIVATFTELPYDNGGEYNADLIYPAGDDAGDDVLTSQDGTLSADRDLRNGGAKLIFDGNKITFDGTPSLKAIGSIVKFSMKDLGETPNAIPVSKLVISSKGYWNPGDDLTITVSLISETDVVYVTIPQSYGKEHTFWFEATANDSDFKEIPYIVKATATLDAGKYYQTTLKMATVGNVIGCDGKFYKNVDDAEGNAEAMIAYLGNEATDAPHGLAIALEDVSDGLITWSNAATAVNTWADSHKINGDASGWRLPSAYDWQRMFSGCGSTHDYVSELTNGNDGMVFDYGEFKSKLTNAGGHAGGSSYSYWSSTAYNEDNAWSVALGAKKFTFINKGINISVLACLAF